MLTYFFVYASVVLCIARGLPVIAEFVYAQKNDILRRPGSEAMKLAIFDIDGTLVRGSSERLFWRYLAARGRQGPRQILCLLFCSWCATCRPAASTRSRRTKPISCGLASADVAALADAFVATRLMRRLYDAVVQRLQQHCCAATPSCCSRARSIRSRRRSPTARRAPRLRDAVQRAQRPLPRAAAGDASVRGCEARPVAAARGAARLRTSSPRPRTATRATICSCSKP